MPIDSVLNSSTGHLTYFFQKCGPGTKKEQNLKNSVQTFLKRC